MGLDKSKIKAGTLRAYLETLESQQRTFQIEIQQLDGASRAYKGAGKHIHNLSARIQQHLEADELTLPTDPVEYAKSLKLWVGRAAQITLNLADKMTADGLLAQGRLQGIEQAIAVARKAAEIEEGKALALESVDSAPEAAQDGRQRPVGMRPGQSIAAERKAAERALAAERKPATKRRGRSRTRVKRDGGDDGTNAGSSPG